MQIEELDGPDRHRLWVNLTIFEKLLGAKRVWAGHQWVLRWQNIPFPVAVAPTSDMSDDDAWVAGYSGPDFCNQRDWMARAEMELSAWGFVDQYMSRLVQIVYPDWDRIENDQAVFQFWFAVATAPPEVRAGVAAELISGTQGV